MTHKNVVDAFDAFVAGSPYSTQQKLDWVNEVEGGICLKIQKPTRVATAIATVIGTSEYTLPTGVLFQHVEVLTVDGVEYPRLDASMQVTMGYYDSGSSKFKIYPIPTAIGSIVIVYGVPYTPSTLLTYASVNVLAESPFSMMYLTYLQAKSEFSLRQYQSYNNIAMLFNAQIDDYYKWWMDRQPIGRRETKCGFRLPVLWKESQQNTPT